MPIKTIGQIALCFGKNEEDCRKQLDGLPDEGITLYNGSIDHIPKNIAADVAKLHPEFMKYYEIGMAVLYQGVGQFRSGTENPVLALQSYAKRRTKGKDVLRLPWVVIWRPLVASEDTDA